MNTVSTRRTHPLPPPLLMLLPARPRTAPAVGTAAMMVAVVVVVVVAGEHDQVGRGSTPPVPKVVPFAASCCLLLVNTPALQPPPAPIPAATLNAAPHAAGGPARFGGGEALSLVIAQEAACVHGKAPGEEAAAAAPAPRETNRRAEATGLLGRRLAVGWSLATTCFKKFMSQ